MAAAAPDPQEPPKEIRLQDNGTLLRPPNHPHPPAQAVCLLDSTPWLDSTPSSRQDALFTDMDQ